MEEKFVGVFDDIEVDVDEEDGTLYVNEDEDEDSTIYVNEDEEDEDSTMYIEEDEDGTMNVEEDDESSDIFSANYAMGEVIVQGKQQKYVVRDRKKSRSGKGNQSEVYFCRGDVDGEEYVVKIYKPEWLRNPKIKENLEGVLHFLHTGNCMNLVKVLEYGNCMIRGQQTLYAVMEKYEPLDRERYKWRGVEDKRFRKNTLSLARDLNHALHTIHNASPKIFHGDIKPDNIMMDPRTKKLVLIDFGAAVQTEDVDGTHAIGHANSQKYMAPERANNATMNVYTDYFSLGVSIAECINGVFPGRVDMEAKSDFTELKGIYEYRIPADLPEHYISLIQGLVYKHVDNDLGKIKKNRWEDVEVASWIKAMENREFEKAATMYPVENDNDDWMKVSSRNNKSSFGNEIILPFKAEGQEERDARGFTSIEQMANFFLEPSLWRSGIDILRDPDYFTPQTVTQPHVLRELQEIRRELKDAQASKETGLSVDAVYYKFMYRYATDKKTFCWKHLPEAKNLEDIADELYLLLHMIQKDANFGEWWINIDRDIRKSQYTIFAEIFRNGILSGYLKRSGYKDNQVIEQCKTVERMFQTLKPFYGNNELAEIFILYRLLTGKKEYTLSNGNTYSTYEEFAKDVTEKSKDINRVDEAMEILKSIKSGNDFEPDFLAWKKMQNK